MYQVTKSSKSVGTFNNLFFLLSSSFVFAWNWFLDHRLHVIYDQLHNDWPHHNVALVLYQVTI